MFDEILNTSEASPIILALKSELFNAWHSSILCLQDLIKINRNYNYYFFIGITMEKNPTLNK